MLFHENGVHDDDHDHADEEEEDGDDADDGGHDADVHLGEAQTFLTMIVKIVK